MKLTNQRKSPPLENFPDVEGLPEFTVVVGENGVGKTRLLLGIKSNDFSSDLFSNQLDSPPNFRREQVGVIYRDFTSIYNVETRNNQTRSRMGINPNPTHDPFLINIFDRIQNWHTANDKNNFNRWTTTEGIEKREFLGKSEFTEIHGDDPILEANKLLTLANLPFKFDITLSEETKHLDFYYQRLAQGSISLRKVQVNGDFSSSFDPSQISSGEKVLIALALLEMNSPHVGSVPPKLILLDEIDCVLHPAAIPQMFEVIRNVFIKEIGCHVILTTHSPTTVALADVHSLILYEKRPTRSAPSDTAGCCKFTGKRCAARN